MANPELEQVVAEVDRELGEMTVDPHLTARQLVRRVARHVQARHLDAYAGNITYNAFLAIFPFLLFLLSLLKIVHATAQLASLIDTAARALPLTAARSVHQIVRAVVVLLPNNLVFSVLLALGSLWAVSAAFRAIMEAMDVAYEVEEDRPLLVMGALAIVLSLAAALLWLVALALIVGGAPIVGKATAALGLGASGNLLLIIAQWMVLISFTWLAFALTYYYAPHLRQSRLAVTPGSIVATIAWLLFSVGFSLVLNHFGRYLVNPLYGLFTGLIVLLLYLYWSSFILLVGAAINQVIEVGDRPSTGSTDVAVEHSSEC
ncbi:MAG: YihY/virulence factor BrkB family protein [Chloroflexota bacterium]|nr:YihY/virulence factor BrkB family protein [Chloroflexota bacterium]